MAPYRHPHHLRHSGHSSHHKRHLPPGLPGRDEREAYAVSKEGQQEVIKQSLYDSFSYPAAGLNSIVLFALPQGQGATPKTADDTNMTNANMLPLNQDFLLNSIEILFFPTTPTVAPDMPAAFGAQAIANNINDSYIFHRSGNFLLTIGQKQMLVEAPLGRFPGKTWFEGNAALSDATTAGAAFQSRIAFARSRGRPYLAEPAKIWIKATENFSVTLSWPTAKQAITNPAKVFVILDGLFYRSA